MTKLKPSTKTKVKPSSMKLKKPASSKEVNPEHMNAHIKVPVDSKNLLKMHLAKVMMEHVLGKM